MIIVGVHLQYKWFCIAEGIESLNKVAATDGDSGISNISFASFIACK